MNKIITMLIASVLCANLTNAQVTINGKVSDDTGIPLPGVSIIEKGSSNGTTTNINGIYQIIVSDSNSILVFSFIGMKTSEFATNGSTTINVELQCDVTGLEEVVTTGLGIRRISSSLGTKRKSNNTNYNVSSTYYGYSTPPAMEVNTESYSKPTENGFKQVMNSPLSTFSIDVDRASYSNVRRFINNGQKPPADAVRVEEMINYFKYNYPQPEEEHPIAISTEASACPWNKNHLLMQVGMQAKEIKDENLPASNLVFLIDVSGSMSSMNKLPLVKSSMKLLIDRLREEDHVAIVVYAGAAAVVLPSTSGKNKDKIINAVNNLEAGGSTAGGAGIKLAYSIAEKKFIKNGNNRVIIATDGDFNVGASSDKEMEQLITEKRETGIYLTCLGYGMGNYKDSKLETLADKGNGNYAYIDNIQEAEKTLVEEFGGTMFTVAKDVKIQIEFNPSQVRAYRLVGYENRLLDDEDFKDDTKDAGEIGSGHMVTALYEIIPFGVESDFIKDLDKLKYQKVKTTNNPEIANIKVRYKLPGKDSSVPFEKAAIWADSPLNESSESFRFAASVAMFGMLLSESEYVKEYDYNDVIQLAQDSRSNDPDGYKAEFVRLVKSAKSF